jgi:predicted PurR-regulated permease PerM
MKEVERQSISKLKEGPDILGAHPPLNQQTVGTPPLDLKKISIITMAIIATVAALKLAKEILIPFVLCLVISYALEPFVVWLERRGLKRSMGSMLILLIISGSLGFGVYTLRDDALAMLDQIPKAAVKVRQVLRSSIEWQGSVAEKVREATRELERTAKEATGYPAGAISPTEGASQKVTLLDLRDYLWWGSRGLAGMLTQLTLIFFFVYFLLLSGNLYRRKLVKVTGPSLTAKKRSLQILNEISFQVERFLLMQLLICLIVGVSSGLIYYAFGLKQALLWGILSGAVTLIPYVGGMIICTAVGIMGILQFGSLTTALYLVSATIGVRTIEGMLLVPWLMSRAARMNGAIIFAALIFWGWVWGVSGLFLAVPMMVIIKAICDRTQQLRPVGEFIGE